MKISFPVMKKKWSWAFSWMTFLLLFSLNGWSQTTERTYQRELPVSEQITVSSNVPTSLDLELQAYNAHTSNTKFGYIVIGKNNVERFFIHKEYVIHTWDKALVRQEVDVEVTSDSEANNEAFLDLLNIELEESKARQVRIDANMNLAKFTLKNSFFRKDHCEIALAEGQTFTVTHLAIKTRLYIPKTAHLKVHSIRNHTLLLEDLEGDLDLDIQYGEVFGKKIGNLNANLFFCYNVIFKEAQRVKASATNSHLKVDSVQHVALGQEKLRKAVASKAQLDSWMDNNSSMNIYNFRKVEKMVVWDTANDDFRLGEIDHLEIKSSVFSDYQILKINQLLELTARNGDVAISELAKDFQNIQLHNTHSKVSINIPDEGAYTIQINDVEAVDFKLPTNAQLFEQTSSKNALFKIGNGVHTGQISIDCDKCELDIWK